METKQLAIEAEFKTFNDDEWKVEGYGSVFDSVDLVGDTIRKGAFEDSVESKMPKMHLEHFRLITPGMWTKAVEDHHGLRLTGYLTRGHSWAKDLRASLRHGTIRGLSIGFTLPEDGYEKTEDGRLITKANLFEVSFVGEPAEPKAQVENWKSEIADLESLQDFERFLRDLGAMPRSAVTAYVSRFKTSMQSDSAEIVEEKTHELESVVTGSVKQMADTHTRLINLLRGN
jgi:HK97 family phage prohead protease